MALDLVDFSTLIPDMVQLLGVCIVQGFILAFVVFAIRSLVGVAKRLIEGR